MDELHRQWEETLPKISGYIKEIDVITAKFEEAARRQEEAVNKLNGNLDNIERGVGEVLLQQRNGFEATGANIEGASKELISSLDASFQNANKNISGISEQQKALADVNKKNLDIVDGKIAKAFDELSVVQVAAFQKAKTQQIITLSIAAVAAALSLIGLFVG
jgi:predicted ribosome quality control (RQC) complex YloA/Tae2 family protein